MFKKLKEKFFKNEEIILDRQSIKVTYSQNLFKVKSKLRIQSWYCPLRMVDYTKTYFEVTCDKNMLYHGFIGVGCSIKRRDKHGYSGWQVDSFGIQIKGSGFEKIQRYYFDEHQFGDEYTEGDVIGFGLAKNSFVSFPDIYRVFITKNGNFVGYGAAISTNLVSQLYPTVALNEFARISVNLGSNPFLFDLSTLKTYLPSLKSRDKDVHSIYQILPKEIWILILQYLTPNELIKISSISCEFYIFSWEDSLWRTYKERKDEDLKMWSDVPKGELRLKYQEMTKRERSRSQLLKGIGFLD